MTSVSCAKGTEDILEELKRNGGVDEEKPSREREETDMEGGEYRHGGAS
jgi:hypothetical protein